MTSKTGVMHDITLTPLPSMTSVMRDAKSWLYWYSISFNLTPSIMCYQLAEILILAAPDFNMTSGGRVRFRTSVRT